MEASNGSHLHWKVAKVIKQIPPLTESSPIRLDCFIKFKVNECPMAPVNRTFFIVWIN